jgi:hypothetical protein
MTRRVAKASSVARRRNLPLALEYRIPSILLAVMIVIGGTKLALRVCAVFSPCGQLKARLRPCHGGMHECSALRHSTGRERRPTGSARQFDSGNSTATNEPPTTLAAQASTSRSPGAWRRRALRNTSGSACAGAAEHCSIYFWIRVCLGTKFKWNLAARFCVSSPTARNASPVVHPPE